MNTPTVATLCSQSGLHKRGKFFDSEGHLHVSPLFFKAQSWSSPTNIKWFVVALDLVNPPIATTHGAILRGKAFSPKSLWRSNLGSRKHSEATEILAKAVQLVSIAMDSRLLLHCPKS